MAPPGEGCLDAFMLHCLPLQEPQPISHWSHKTLVHVAFGHRSSKQDRPNHSPQEAVGSKLLDLSSHPLLGQLELSEDLQVAPTLWRGVITWEGIPPLPTTPPSLLGGAPRPGALEPDG